MPRHSEAVYMVVFSRIKSFSCKHRFYCSAISFATITGIDMFNFVPIWKLHLFYKFTNVPIDCRFLCLDADRRHSRTIIDNRKETEWASQWMAFKLPTYVFWYQNEPWICKPAVFDMSKTRIFYFESLQSRQSFEKCFGLVWTNLPEIH